MTWNPTENNVFASRISTGFDYTRPVVTNRCDHSPDNVKFPEDSPTFP